jgi:hypothetical protein
MDSLNLAAAYAAKELTSWVRLYTTAINPNRLRVNKEGLDGFFEFRLPMPVYFINSHTVAFAQWQSL